MSVSFLLYDLQIFAAAVLLAGLAALVYAWIAGGSPRLPARTLLFGASIPALPGAANLGNLFGRRDEVMPIALAAKGLAFNYAIRSHQIKTLKPIARQVVLDSMGDGLLVVDQSGRLVEYNPAAARIAKLTTEPIGQPLEMVSHDLALGAALGKLCAASTAGEQIITCLEAEPRYIHASRTPLDDRIGQPLGVLLMLRDITRQTYAEQALERQAADLTALHNVATAIGATIEPRELLPAIVCKTSDALAASYASVGLIDPISSSVLITAESGEANSIALTGSRFTLPQQMLDQFELAATPIAISDAQHDARLACLHSQLARHQIHSVLIAPLRANDRLIGTLHFASTIADFFGQEKIHLAQMIAGYVAAAIANAQLFESSQQAVRTKTAILDTISHEFRTPITAILGFTELAQEQVLGPINDEQQEALSAVHRNAHRLLKLVDDLLDLARLEAGQLDMAIGPVELGLSIKEALTLVGAQSPGKPIPVQVELPASLPMARADAMWLRRSLVHLLTHTLGAGLGQPVTIRAFQQSGAGMDEYHVCIAIHNPALELSQAEQAAIFEAFERVPHSVSDLTISSIARMGLAISKRAIDQMQGQLALHSQPGAGSTFVISLRAGELALEHARA